MLRCIFEELTFFNKKKLSFSKTRCNAVNTCINCECKCAFMTQKYCDIFDLGTGDLCIAMEDEVLCSYKGV